MFGPASVIDFAWAGGFLPLGFQNLSTDTANLPDGGSGPLLSALDLVVAIADL